MAWMISTPAPSSTTPTSNGSGPGRTDEHGDGGIVSLERSPVVSNCVEHVLLVDAVLAGCRLDVHVRSLRLRQDLVNIC